MIVKVINLGSYWYTRYGRDNNCSDIIASKTAHFNTTGIISGSSVLRKWTLQGVIRFNAFQFQFIQDYEGFNYQNYLFNGIDKYRGTNRLLLAPCKKQTGDVDYFLVCINNDIHGSIDYLVTWRTKGVLRIATSEYHGAQESLLLVPPSGLIITTKGKWGISWKNGKIILKMVLPI